MKQALRGKSVLILLWNIHDKKHSLKIKTLADQKQFWQWILDPSENSDVQIQFGNYDPETVKINDAYTVKATDDEKECEQVVTNTVRRIGFTTFIESKPGMHLIN